MCTAPGVVTLSSLLLVLFFDVAVHFEIVTGTRLPVVEMGAKCAYNKSHLVDVTPSSKAVDQSLLEKGHITILRLLARQCPDMVLLEQSYSRFLRMYTDRKI